MQTGRKLAESFSTAERHFHRPDEWTHAATRAHTQARSQWSGETEGKEVKSSSAEALATSSSDYLSNQVMIFWSLLNFLK